MRLSHERLGGLIAGDITGPQITKLARDGNLSAVEVFGEVGRWLGEGIATLCSVLDPAVVAIGGGVAEAGDLLLKPAQEAFDRTLSAADHRPHAELRLAALGNRAGLIGAADLARSAPTLSKAISR